MTDMFPPNLDCFGRDKFADYRDDMGGVGSFLRQNRTLYIGRISVTENVEEAVARNFGEWGEVERIRVLNNRGVAFVTYLNESSAQFAKEAMAHQSLGEPESGDEVLNVRWATEDPNPLAQAREKRRLEEQAADAIRKLLPADYVAELEGTDPEARKRRKHESSFGLEGYEAPDEVWFARGANAVNESAARTVVSSTKYKTIQMQVGQDHEEAAEDQKPSPQIEASPAASNGLFSALALSNLKSVSKLAANPPAPAPAAVGLGLGDYDSDDE